MKIRIYLMFCELPLNFKPLCWNKVYGSSFVTGDLMWMPRLIEVAVPDKFSWPAFVLIRPWIPAIASGGPFRWWHPPQR